MKIAILCNRTGFGGAQNTTASLANAFMRRGHDVVVFVDKNRLRSRESMTGACLVHLPMTKCTVTTWRCLSISNIVSALKKLYHLRPDVCISISTGHMPICILAKLILGIPAIYYEVGLRTPRIARLFDGLIVANSEETRQHLSGFLKRNPEHISVVRARIRVPSAMRESPISRASGEEDRCFRVVMMSRMVREKLASIVLAMDIVMRLCQTGHPVRLYVYGTGPEREVCQVHADAINSRCLGEVVCIHEPVADAEAVLQKADLCFGIGRSAWEAMAVGIPTAILGAEGYAGMVSPINVRKLKYFNFTARGGGVLAGPAEIADRLSRVINNNRMQRWLGAYSFRLVSREYSVDIGAAQFEQFLAEHAQSLTTPVQHAAAKVLGVIAVVVAVYFSSLIAWVRCPRFCWKVLRSQKY